MRRAVVLGMLALLAGCSELPGLGPEEPPAAVEAPVWPEPPLKPRVRYLYAFRGPEDLDLRPSFLRRLWEWAVGGQVREMVRPYGVAVGDGLIVVADPGLRAVHFFDRREDDYRRISEVGEDALASPVGVAIAPYGVVVADSALARVFILDREGELLRRIDGLRRPTGVAVDPASGRLYVADTLAHRVVVFGPEGRRLFAFGRRGGGRGEFNFPTHLALAGDRIIVNDTMNFRLQTFDLDGRFLGSFGRQGDGSGFFAQSKGIGVDSEGHLYVADALFDRVQIFDPEAGSFLLAFGGQGGGVGQMWLPAGLVVESDRIYVADSYNRRVQVFEFLGGG